MTPLMAACVDLALAAEREEASLSGDPVAVVTLLLERGAPLDAVSAEGATALSLCSSSRAKATRQQSGWPACCTRQEVVFDPR